LSAISNHLFIHDSSQQSSTSSIINIYHYQVLSIIIISPPTTMPRAVVRSSSGPVPIPTNTLIIDNGGHTIKAGFATPHPTSNDCRIIPNCIARGRTGARSQRIYIADQLDDCKDFAEMAFRRPVEKGYVVNWDGEMDIWKQAFFNSDAKLHVSLSPLQTRIHCAYALCMEC